ncbi:uncharacterized protein LOC120288858 [Eucalyptus grandis]|uniref:uncharacterized protein LOC120288858 n=1 Tax=Eucalyptus grandis TaxID=71139 RepID=UPI00192EB8A7|nr:uncharacterized protein LOC120288858 [Eucalyptus grandis]
MEIFAERSREGAITVARVPLVLQEWEPALELKKDSHLIVPVWIRRRNLPLAFWSSQGISKVASAVGKPLYVDLCTKQIKMLAFAKVCVEITMKQPIYDAIEVVHNGESCLVGVEYEWRPTACSGCGIFSHKCAHTPARPSLCLPLNRLRPLLPLFPKDRPRQAKIGWNLAKGKKKKDPPPREIALALLVSSGDEDRTNKEKAAAVDRSLPSTSTCNAERGLRIITMTEAHAPTAEEGRSVLVKIQ